ncbi:MAG: LysM peptidoglycan-binding domain-containing protein [Bdellovibrionota bacterium]
MKLVPWMVLLSLTLVSCSGSKSSQPVKEETPQVELSDADEFIENPSGEPAAVAETTEEDPVADASPEVAATESDPTSELVIEDEGPAASPATTSSSTRASTSLSSNMMEYKVQKNETLMMIAFKLYGDYGWWKKLAGWNSDKLKGGQIVRAGQTLKYMAPSEEFVWNPQGLPYLIRTGDTLGLISKSVYQTPKKWKLIWENNRPLIKNANLIFAGFTIYYLENGREVASGI